MKIIVLGSGTSHGIPVVGCSCPVCTSDDERDKRTRASVYIEGSGGEKALIDAGPEFRLQALRAGINRIDGIFLTHAHADHIHGLDDIRPLSRQNPLPVYGNKPTVSEMKERFSYIFGTGGRKSQEGGGKPRLKARVAEGPVRIGGLEITPVPVKHGVLDILGWLVSEELPLGKAANHGNGFLYLTDTSGIPPASSALLAGKGIRVVIIGGLRMHPHKTHFTFEQALNAALGLRAGAKEVYLTHICHSHPHTEIEGFCESFRENHLNMFGGLENVSIHPARDGLVITL